MPNRDCNSSVAEAGKLWQEGGSWEPSRAPRSHAPEGLMSRNFKFGLVVAVFMLAAVELLSWALLNLAMWLNSLRLYSADVFLRMSDDDIVRAVGKRPLGWPSSEGPRAAPPADRRVCGSAFGDSMTYGAEVADNEAWIHLLSLRFDCTIANYGESGYGLDQTVLHYERVATEGEFVILGFFLEMIRRSVAASWTFYTPSHPMKVYQVKPYFTLDEAGLRLHPMPDPLTRDTIAAHHAADYYLRRVSTAMEFPYTTTAARALHVRFARTDDYRRDTEKYLDPAHPSGSGVLLRRLIDRFAETARRRNERLAVVLIPGPRRLMTDSSWEQDFTDDLRRRGDICVVDLKPPLREHARPLGGRVPTEPIGHYTAMGNRWIADAVAAGLINCGIAPRRLAGEER
jgi:hypothetical protein